MLAALLHVALAHVTALRLPHPTPAVVQLSALRRTSIVLSAAEAVEKATEESTELLDALRKRAAEVKEGAGRFFRVNSLVGFLNVHKEPGDPWRTDNVVQQLHHSTVVESIREEGVWVLHDGGGWSIRVYDGHEFLVLVE